jgi:surfeit locus 1 family protein
MLSKLRASGLLWPAVMTLLGVIALVWLGNWQMRRLAWKEGLLAAIAARTTAAPVPVAAAAASAERGDDVEYERVSARGRFRNDRELHLYAFDESAGPGFHVITPLVMDDGGVALVNRGYVPYELKDPARRPSRQIDGETTVIGLVRMPEEKRLFTPTNDQKGNIWYWRDVGAMAAAAMGGEAGRVLPFVIDAQEGAAPKEGWPKQGTTRLELPNRHLEYALTWYGLAAALVAVFGAFAASRWKRESP